MVSVKGPRPNPLWIIRDNCVLTQIHKFIFTKLSSVTWYTTIDLESKEVYASKIWTDVAIVLNKFCLITMPAVYDSIRILDSSSLATSQASYLHVYWSSKEWCFSSCLVRLFWLILSEVKVLYSSFYFPSCGIYYIQLYFIQRMAPWLKGLPALPEDLGFIPSTQLF